jgi:DNA repair protein RadC
MYVRELTVSYRRRLLSVPSQNRSITKPVEAASVFASLIEDEPVEVFAVLFLTTKQQLIGYHEVSRGSIDCTIVNPRDVFRAALLGHAASIVVGHNHPSGDPTPSPDDVALTRRIVQAGELIGIEVADHIVIGHDGRYFSFKEAGVMSCT